MNWWNLKDSRCPQCGGNLRCGILDLKFSCDGLTCAFTIGREAYDRVIQNLYKKRDPKLKSFEDTLGDLNNFGHAKVAEDFSDSPHLK